MKYIRRSIFANNYAVTFSISKRIRILLLQHVSTEQ